MHSKVFLYGLLVSICGAFTANAKDNVNSERDIRHEEKQDFACDSLPGQGTCYEESQGKVFGDIVLYKPSSAPVPPPPPGDAPASSYSPKLDADGLPIPPQQKND